MNELYQDWKGLGVTMLLFFLVTSAATAQINIWRGSVNSDWQTPNNWSLGHVPTTTENVSLSVTAAFQPVLSGTAVANSVEIPASTTLTIGSNGTLTINGSRFIASSTTGFYNGGVAVNEGSLKLGNIASVGSIGLTNVASFSNLAQGIITIDHSTLYGLSSQGSTSRFLNSGTLTIGSSFSAGQTGIYNTTASSFSNLAGGYIGINQLSSSGISNLTNSRFVNDGIITVGDLYPVGQTALLNNGASFSNLERGTITLDRSTSSRITNFGPNNSFVNSGTLVIGNSSTAQFGLVNSNFAVFDNQEAGYIAINRAVSYGLFNDNDGNFRNSGQLLIGQSVSTGQSGISNISSFSNLSGGRISIDRSTNTGLTNSGSGSFVNSGSLTIGASSSVGIAGISNSASFSNLVCGQINLPSVFRNTNTFSNQGLMLVSTTLTHSNTGFTNEGIIAYPLGNPIPNVTNQGILSLPRITCGSSPINPALQIAVSSSLSVNNTVYTNSQLTNPAGTFSNNTFTPTNLPEGNNYLLWFTATDGRSGCTYTVPLSLTVLNSVGSLTLNSPTLTCSQTAVVLSASATRGSSYSLSDGQVSPSGQFTISRAGTYTVIATGSNGCISSTAVTINNPKPTDALAGSISVSGPASCAIPARLTAPVTGRAFVFTGPGGYVFSNVYRASGNYTAFAEEIKLGGTYILSVSDADGCPPVNSSVFVQGPASCP